MKPTIHLEVTCLVAPLQIEGTVAGIEVYYRARHGRWSIELNGLPNVVLPAEACAELAGTCPERTDDSSVSFAMSKIFAVQQLREAIVDADIKDFDEQYEAAGASWPAAKS